MASDILRPGGLDNVVRGIVAAAEERGRMSRG
jgi:hypothetical protein